MASRKCPICGNMVRLENMRRHYANVHPGKDVSAAITQREERESSAPRRRAGTRFYARRSFLALVALVVVALVAGALGLPVLLQGTSSGAASVASYCGGEGTAEHYHPLLIIHENGVPQPLPYDPNPTPTPKQQAYIGYLNAPGYTNPNLYCPQGQLHALHTHDGSGILHAELPGGMATPTLGDFFTIWGEPLGSDQLWRWSGSVKATVYDADTGATRDYSANPAGIPLYNPSADHPLPPSLIFGGAYGDGQSGGTYSGEVIWLNVTA